MMSNKKSITIEFDNEAAAKHFAHWLDGQGEQNYWTWMEEREQEEAGNITATQFHYHEGNKFCPNDIIKTTCGRLSK